MKLEGELREIELIPKLIELSDERFTGAVRFENEEEGVIKIIYFKEGNVLSASTNDRSDSIDEILLRSSKVSREHIKQALAKRKESETLGDALLALGFITRKELAWVRRVQLIGILRSLQRWQTGGYTLVADYLPKREEGTIFNLQQIVVELIVTEQDRSAVEAAIGGGDQVFERTPAAESRYQQLGLNEDADRIFARVDGQRSATEIASEADMDAFAVFKLLNAFLLLGVISPATSIPQVKHELSLDVEPLPELPELGALPTQIDSFSNEGLPAQGEELDTLSNYDWEEEKETAAHPKMTLPMVERPAEMLLHDEPGRSGVAAIPAPGARPERGGSSTMFMRPAPKKSSKGLLIALLLLVVLGAAAYGGYWYLNRPVVEVAAPPVVKLPKPSPVTSPTDSGTIVETALSTAPATTTVAAVTTSTTTPSTTTASDTARPAVSTPVQPSTAPVTVASQPPVRPPAVVVPTPASSDPKRQALDRKAADFASESSAVTYALQIAFLCEPSSLQSAIESGGSNVWFVPAQLGQRHCFRVFWGRYQTRAEAQRNVAQVPASYRAGRVVAVKLSEVVKK
jgi:septal ring-binding cell division protein DamX